MATLPFYVAASSQLRACATRHRKGTQPVALDAGWSLTVRHLAETDPADPSNLSGFSFPVGTGLGTPSVCQLRLAQPTQHTTT
jgi:hypothetical protein